MKAVAVFTIFIFLILSILVYKYSFKIKESFQTANPVKESNIFINPDEIYLLAPNAPPFSISAPSDSYLYNNGFTYEEAKAACIANRGKLADITAIASPPEHKSSSGISLSVAVDLSANWCAAGWTTASSTYAYFPVSDFSIGNICKLNSPEKLFLPTTQPSASIVPTETSSTIVGLGSSRTTVNLKRGTPTNTTATPDPGKFYLPGATAEKRDASTKGIGVYNPNGGKAFAICVGPKPPEPAASVNRFNAINYSMYTYNMMSYLTTGYDSQNPYNNDIFPVPFTSLQAFYALENAVDPSSGSTGGNPTPYNLKNARAFLLNKYSAASSAPVNALKNEDPLNAPLFTPEMTEMQNEMTTNPLSDTCNVLSRVYTNMDTSLNNLKSLFRDISGNVNNAIKIKDINGNIQSVIASVCNNTRNKVESAACQRLVSLDYDIFYRNKSTKPDVQKNTITDLEELNYNLLIRQCEIQQGLGTLQMILNSFPNNQTCSTTHTNLTTKYGINTVVKDAASSPVPINCNTYFDASGEVTDDPSLNGSSPSTAFKVGVTTPLAGDIPLNNIDTFKVKLEEISPFFASNQYASIVETILNQLSLTLRSPLPSQFFSVTSIVNNTKKLYETIVGIFPKLS